MQQKPKIWYSILGGRSQEDHISFYEPAQFTWAAQLENNWNIIAEEIAAYLVHNEEKIKPYFNTSIVTAKSRWRTSAFIFWTFRVKKNIKQCPRTMALLEQIPGISSAMISILESDTEIKPHRGDTNAIIRVHLPLKAPVSLPECGFKVNEEERSWEEGKLLFFNDAARHTAWNYSEKRRYVLIFDIIRPEFSSKKYRISSMVLAGLLRQAILQKVSYFKKIPKTLLTMMLYTIAFVLNPILRLQSKR